MKIRIKFIFAICLLCVVGSLHAKDEISVLKKTWQIGYTAKNSQQQLTEYVLQGESVENWRELVTRQIIVDPTSKISLNRLIESIRNRFDQDNCQNLTWEIVNSTESEVLVSWFHNGCTIYPPQAERSLFTRVPKGICRWAYATKTPPISALIEEELNADLANQSCE